MRLISTGVSEKSIRIFISSIFLYQENWEKGKNGRVDNCSIGAIIGAAMPHEFVENGSDFGNI